jgi:hypothetical protein
MTDPNKTLIVMLLDRSGSMSSIAQDTIGGFKTFIDEQKKAPGECLVSLFQFDDRYDVVYVNRPVDTVGELPLLPRGSTALYDAMGKTITDVGRQLAAMPEAERPGHVIFVVMTDGHENFSREFSAAEIKRMVEHQTEKYGWNFVFIGANQDAILTARSLGISGQNALTATADSLGTHSVYRSLAKNTTRYRVGASAGISGQSLRSRLSFDESQRDEQKR